MDDIRQKIHSFLNQLRLHIRQHGLAYKTEQTYVHWVKRFIYFHNKQVLTNPLGPTALDIALPHTYWKQVMT